MNHQVNTWIDEHKEELINELCTFLSYKSLPSDTIRDGAPFGLEIQETLDYLLKLSQKHGFHTKDLSGYAGCIDFPMEKKEEMMGILGHLDVVPVDDNWDTDPFTGTIIDGKLFGRGTADDKGPIMATLFAMRAIKDSGIELTKNVRLIVGCDEESGMSCIKHYKKVEQIPDFSISPDGEYPLVNSEKNIFDGYFTASFQSEIRIQSGERSNIVPPLATATLPLELDIVHSIVDEFGDTEQYKYDITTLTTGCELVVHGHACHASLPELGKNALQELLYLLEKMPLSSTDHDMISLLVTAFKKEYYGESVGLDVEDESGRLTLNVGVMNWNEQGFELQLNIRAPLSIDEACLKNAFETAFANSVIQYDDRCHFSQGLYIPEEHNLVQSLLKVYRSFTNDMTPPAKIGGGTYARMLPNAVAFGVEFPGDPMVAHMPNEFMEVEQLILNTKILANAILELTT